MREATLALWDYVGSVIDTRTVIRFAGQGYDADVTDEERDTLAALVAALGHRPELRDGVATRPAPPAWPTTSPPGRCAGSTPRRRSAWPPSRR